MALGCSPGRATVRSAVTDPNEPLIASDLGSEPGMEGYRKMIRCYPRRTAVGGGNGHGHTPPHFDTKAPLAVALALLVGSLAGPMATAVGFAIALGMAAWRGRVKSVLPLAAMAALFV